MEEVLVGHWFDSLILGLFRSGAVRHVTPLYLPLILPHVADVSRLLLGLHFKCHTYTEKGFVAVKL